MSRRPARRNCSGSCSPSSLAGSNPASRDLNALVFAVVAGVYLIVAIPLELTFDRESWAEITDARGERLLFGLSAAGRQVTVRGEPPIAEAADDATDLEALGEALESLTKVDPALAELVDLHFFAGYSLVEVARMRDVSERTVQRDWRKARLLLFRAMEGPGAP